MRRSKLILAALALIVTSPALAQSGCGGQFGAGKFCGNPNGTTGLPGPVALTPGVLAPIAGGTVIANPTGATAAPIATTAPVLGIPGASTGQVGLAGATGGTSILRAQAAAGTAVSLLPTASGTLVSTSASPVAIDLVTGRLSITGLTGGVLAGAVPAFTRTPVFGVPGSAIGTLGLAGNTSGTVTITPQATAGTPTLILPNTSGTFAVNATSPLALSATTGLLTCPTCVTSSGGGGITGVAPIVVSGAGAVSITSSALTKTDDANVTMTLGGTPGSALIAPVSLTLGWAGQLSVPRGGTGLASGTSGGIPYFNSGTTMASSAALAANQLVLGGGAGAAPATLGSLGTTTTVLHGNAAGVPSFGAVSLTADVSGILPLAGGGTNAALTASNGGILWSNATQAQILAGTATARQMLQSGASGAPAWSTATWPATTTANQLLYSSAANTVGGLATANNGVLGTSGSGVPSITATPTLGTNGGTGGQITLNGATSGSAVIKVAPVAGTTNIQFPVGNGTSGQVVSTDGSGNWSYATVAGTGTVTSVSVTAGTGITQSGSPVTTSGAITVNVDKATTANIWGAASNKVLTSDTVFNGAGGLVTLTGTTSVTPDFSTGFNFVFSTAASTNFTLQNPTNAKVGQTGCIYIQQAASGTGSQITFGTNWFTPGGVTGSTLSLTLTGINRLCYFVFSSTVIDFTLDSRLLSH